MRDMILRRHLVRLARGQRLGAWDVASAGFFYCGLFGMAPLRASSRREVVRYRRAPSPANTAALLAMLAWLGYCLVRTGHISCPLASYTALMRLQWVAVCLSTALHLVRAQWCTRGVLLSTVAGQVASRTMGLHLNMFVGAIHTAGLLGMLAIPSYLVVRHLIIGPVELVSTLSSLLFFYIYCVATGISLMVLVIRCYFVWHLNQRLARGGDVHQALQMYSALLHASGIFLGEQAASYALNLAVYHVSALVLLATGVMPVRLDLAVFEAVSIAVLYLLGFVAFAVAGEAMQGIDQANTTVLKGLLGKSGCSEATRRQITRFLLFKRLCDTRVLMLKNVPLNLRLLFAVMVNSSFLFNALLNLKVLHW